jgi:hypothetical protein
MRMRIILAFIFGAASLGGIGCSSPSLNCSTIACAGHSSLSYELCSDLDGDATYKFDGSSCSCSGYYTGGCTSCAQKIDAYCGVTPDLSVPQDLSLPKDLSLPIDDLELSSQD